IELVMRRLGDFGRHQFGHALDVDERAGFAGAFSDRICHRLDVTVSGIIEHKYLGHDGLLWVGWVQGFFEAGQGRHGRAVPAIHVLGLPGFFVDARALLAKKRFALLPGHDEASWAYAGSTSTS